MFKNILLAVDGSNYTDSVLSHGIFLAQKFKSRLHVVTIADIRIFEWVTAMGSDGFVPIVPSGVYQDESRKILEEKCDKVLKKCSKILKEAKTDFEVEKLFGPPMDCILERAQIADLLIMGKRGEFSRLETKSLGATVEAVSRNTRKPLIVAEQTFKPIKKILAAYDGSSHANQALMFVGHLAEGTSSLVSVICVTNDTEIGKHYIQEAGKYLTNYKVKVNSHLISGHPEKEIVNYAIEQKVDMIGIGAFGHSRIREAILGSTTEHILRFSPCSVLLAK
jgi:nucleotide-binding universal stress UspA family protein